MDRVFDSDSKDRGFESRRARVRESGGGFPFFVPDLPEKHKKVPYFGKKGLDLFIETHYTVIKQKYIEKKAKSLSIKRWLAACLVLFLLACSLPAYATDWVAKVTQQSTVYAKANTSSKVLGKVKANTVLTVDATKNGWARVTMNGKTGFMKAANVKKTTKTMYVNVASMAVYASNKTSSKKLAAMAYGESVKMEATNGEWARIVNGRKVGFCKKSSLTSKNPNTMKTTVYTQSANVKVYKHPSTSADLKGTLKKMNTKLTVVAMFDGQTWCRVKNGSQYGFIKKSDLDTRKYDGYSTARGAGGKAIAMDWWKSSIQSIVPRGGTAIVTDVKTGITWKVYRGGGTNHADVQPKTDEDTRAMKKACGSDYATWHRRAIWVSIGGKRYAASMNCMAHGDGSISGNNYNGHFCIHFVNSRTHGGNAVCPLHQAAIKTALSAS